MVGMLLASANPTDAPVRLQLILLYALLGSVAIAGLVATGLAYRNFFTQRPAAAANPKTDETPIFPCCAWEIGVSYYTRAVSRSSD